MLALILIVVIFPFSEQTRQLPGQIIRDGGSGFAQCASLSAASGVIFQYMEASDEAAGINEGCIKEQGTGTGLPESLICLLMLPVLLSGRTASGGRPIRFPFRNSDIYSRRRIIFFMEHQDGVKIY